MLEGREGGIAKRRKPRCGFGSCSSRAKSMKHDSAMTGRVEADARCKLTPPSLTHKIENAFSRKPLSRVPKPRRRSSKKAEREDSAPMRVDAPGCGEHSPFGLKPDEPQVREIRPVVRRPRKFRKIAPECEQAAPKDAGIHIAMAA